MICFLLAGAKSSSVTIDACIAASPGWLHDHRMAQANKERTIAGWRKPTLKPREDNVREHALLQMLGDSRHSYCECTQRAGTAIHSRAFWSGRSRDVVFLI